MEAQMKKCKYLTLMITLLFVAVTSAAPIVFQKETPGLADKNPEKLSDNNMRTALMVDWKLKDKSQLGALNPQDPRQEFELYKGQSSAIDVAALSFEDDSEPQVAIGGGSDAAANFAGGFSRASTK